MTSIRNFIIENETIINTMSLPLSLLAFIVGFTTLIYTIKLFYMKRGINVKCSYSIASSIDSDDSYIGDFILENRKDKSIAIFQTYLKIGHNYYLELENFENYPLIIKPFEVYYKKFDSILFYSVSMSRIKLDKLLNNRKVKKKILLYTTEGTYEVNAHINMTNPITQFFKNYTTAIIQANRLTYENKAYGINTKFLVEFFSNNEKSVLSLRADSYRTKFKKFDLTKESLKDKESLEIFLNNQLKDNLLNNITKINVIDFGEEVKNTLNTMDKNKIIEAKYYGYFHYFVLGKALTIIENKRLKLINYFRNNKIGKRIKKFIFCEK